MFPYRHPMDDITLHYLNKPIRSIALKFKEKREEIIMACLKGGQHIDDAIEAAERLYPQRLIDEENESHRSEIKQWEEKLKYLRQKQSEKAKAAMQWWPFK